MRITRRVPVLLASVMAAAVAMLAGNCGGVDKVKAPLPTDLPGLQGVGLHHVWQRQVNLDPDERVKKVWRLGTSVYVATTNSRIVRLEARTGVLRWSNSLGQENFEIYRPVELKDADGYAASQVLVVTRGEAFIFSQETGDEMRMGRLGISVSADPVVIGNTLAVGGADTFYGLYLDRLGMKNWKIPVPGDLFVSPPLAMDNNILVGSMNGKLWRINADDGDWDWKDRKTNGRIIGGLAADYNALYVPCDDQRVYAFRTDSGGQIWETQLDNRLEETPVLAGPVVLVRSVDRKLSALARQTGEIRWSKTGIVQVATVNDETVWVADTAGNLRRLDLETGEEKASAPTKGVQVFVRNNMDQDVILVTQAGLVGLYSPSAVNEQP